MSHKNGFNFNIYPYFQGIFLIAFCLGLASADIPGPYDSNQNALDLKKTPSKLDFLRTLQRGMENSNQVCFFSMHEF